MKTGMNLLLWTPVVTEDHLGLIESIKDWGFDGVEFPMFDPGASPWSKFAQALDGLGLDRTACTIMPEGANLIGESVEEREAGLSHLKRCIDSMATLGGEIFLGPLHSPCGRLVGRGSNDDEWKMTPSMPTSKKKTSRKPFVSADRTSERCTSPLTTAPRLVRITSTGRRLSRRLRKLVTTDG